MRTLVSLSLIMVFLAISNLRVAATHVQTQSSLPDKPKPSARVLTEDTPVRLRLMQNLSSATAKVNDKVDFEVIEPVKIGDTVVIEQGATAIATVTKATSKKSFGRSGKLDVNIDYVRLINGDKVNLRAVKGGSGASRTGVMTGAVVATAIVFFPAAPLFFFMKGKNIEIPKGTEITAYIAADTAVNLPTQQSPTGVSGSQNAATDSAAAASTAQPNANTGSATLLVNSDPPGAEININGKFVGTTKSTLKLFVGEHAITIAKPGYKEWKRTIMLNPGSEITIDAVLEKTPQ